MSRAFVKEDHQPADILPELPISARPNYVTPRGLAAIDAKLAELNAALAAATDEVETARLQRDLRYWSARHASAHLVSASEVPNDEVAFGSRVTLRRDGGRPETIEIVGEDEADPAAGKIAWVAPFAAALIGAEPGDIVEVGPRNPPIKVEILSVEDALED
jgi:transcription elongation GreA/GreB family factor